jgi:RNA polymerase sigma factor (sigma-70 family)
MNPEALYLSNLPSIERIAAFAARRARLSAVESEEFVQLVRVRLFEDDYALIRKFEGRSQFTAYLTTVILRLLAQYRVQMWGKWRPSLEAKRLGDPAITLERLIDRDGYTLDEAVRMLTSSTDVGYTVDELRAIYARLPLPREHVTFEPVPDAADQDESDTDDDPPDVRRRKSDSLSQAVDGGAESSVLRAERRGKAAKIGRILEEATSGLPEEDQTIIRMRFGDGRKVPEIARVLGLDQKKLYRRLDKIFLLFRRALEEQAIDRTEVDAVLTDDGVDDELTVPNVRTIKTADDPGIYIDPGTARRTLQELLGEREHSEPK